MFKHYSSSGSGEIDTLRLAIQLLPDAIFIVERQSMRYIWANDLACSATGYNPDELLSLGPADLDTQHSKKHLQLLFDELLESNKKTQILATTRLRKDGSSFFVEVSLRGLIYDEKPCIVFSERNITERKAGEQKLVESKEQLRLLINHIKDYAIYMVDPGGIIKTWNDGALKLFGYTAEEIIGKPIQIFYQKEDNENDFVSILFQMATEKGSIETEGRRVRKDGSVFLANVTICSITETSSHVKGFAVIIRDITEEKGLKLKLERFNAQLREQVQSKTAELTNIFDRITDAFIAIDKDWRYTYMNSKVGEILNLNPAHLIGKPITAAYPEQSELPIFEKYRQAMAEQKDVIYDSYHASLNRWFRNRIYPSPEGLSVFFHDITEQKKAQEELEKSELRYRTLVENASDAIVITDGAGNYLDINSAACSLLGYSHDEMLTLNARNVVFDPDGMAEVATTFELLRSGKKSMREVMLRRKDGSSVDVESHAVMLPDGTFLGILRNITERKKIQNLLKNSETSLKEAQRLAHLGDWRMEHATGAIYWSDEVYNILEVNSEVQPSYDLFMSLVYPEDREFLETTFKQSLDERSEYELTHRVVTATGRLKYVNEKVKTFFADSGKPLRSIGTIQDITEQRKAQQSLQKSEARFKRVFDSNMVGFVFFNMDGRILEANDRFLEMLGYERADFFRGNVTWNDITPEEYHYLDAIAHQQIASTGISQPFEKEYIRKDGTRLPITIAAASVEESNHEKGVAIILDITQRKRAEEEIKQSQSELRALAANLQTIREAERANMAREIHDELGQQLTGIKMELYWLNKNDELSILERKKSMQDTIKLVDETIKSVRKIAAELHPGILDSLGLVQALKWYSQEFQTRSHLRVDFTHTPAEINVDPKIAIGLFRIYQESLTNVARHAEATVVTSSLELVSDQLILKINDNGKGFAKYKFAKKKTLGLLGMKERSLMMGGDYDIASEPGKGTLVQVIVPYSPGI